MGKHQVTIAAIGCTGEVAKTFLNGFIDEGIALRILARDPRSVEACYPQAAVASGSMMNSADVARVTSQVDAAFLITLMSKRDKPTGEIEAARKVLAGAQEIGLNLRSAFDARGMGRHVN